MLYYVAIWWMCLLDLFVLFCLLLVCYLILYLIVGYYVDLLLVIVLCEFVVL